jgi:hypothetical protein
MPGHPARGSNVLQHVALVSESDGVEPGELAEVAAAVQKQVLRDFGPLWQAQATVDAFPRLEDVPEGYWRVVVADGLSEFSIGFHRARDGQPFAMVLFREDWHRIASHEVLEMLADPSGDWLVAGDSPDPRQGRVEFLVEVCDPCALVTYKVNGLELSDFITPDYHSPVRAAGARYSFTGSVPGPREILPGGYLGWRLPGTNQWFKASRLNGQVHIDPAPGPPTGACLREAMDRHVRAEAPKKGRRPRRDTPALRRLRAAPGARAARFREELAALYHGS